MRGIIIFIYADNNLISDLKDSHQNDPNQEIEKKNAIHDLDDISVNQMPENTVAFQIRKFDDESNTQNYEVRIGKQINNIDELDKVLALCPNVLKSITKCKIKSRKLSYPIAVYLYKDPKAIIPVPKVSPLSGGIKTEFVDDFEHLKIALAKTLLEESKTELIEIKDKSTDFPVK